MAYNKLNKSPLIHLTPLRLSSIRSIHLPTPSCKKLLFSSPKICLPQINLHSHSKYNINLPIPYKHTKPASVFNQKHRGHPSIFKCNARRCLTCHHISCKSTITSSVNGDTFNVITNSDIN